MKSDNEKDHDNFIGDRVPSTAGMRKIDVRDILQGDNAVCLEFEEKLYILRITSNRKLILTK